MREVKRMTDREIYLARIGDDSGEINFAVRYEILAILARISSTGASRPTPS